MEQPHKKRANDRELNRDNVDLSDEEGGEEIQKGFVKASDEKMAGRKIAKVRRPAGAPESAPEASKPPVPAATPNPFASVAFGGAAEKKEEEAKAEEAGKKEAEEGVAPTTTANPFAGVKLASTANPPPSAPASSTAFATSSFSAFASKNPFASILNNGSNGAAATAAAASPAQGGFSGGFTGSFGASGAGGVKPAGFGGFTFGGSTTAFGGSSLFGGAGGFGAGKKEDKRDEEDAPECDADEGEEEEEGDEEQGGIRIGNDRFGDVPSSILGRGEDRPPLVQLPPAPERVLTGEEGEKTVFASEGKLYQFDKDLPQKWKERGTGELKVNVNGQGKARIIMRQKGNMRLALNAAVWHGMTISVMEGGRGITFSVVNVAEGEPEGERKESNEASAAPSEGEKEAKEGKDSAAHAKALATYAFRCVPKTMQQPLIDTLNRYKDGM